MTPVESYLLGGRLPVFRLVLLAQEEASHLHLGSTAVWDIAVTSRFARGGLTLGIRLAWGREREDSLSRLLEGARRPTLGDSISLPGPPTHQEFGPGSGRRCEICWQPAWARGPGPWLPSLCAASAQWVHWGWACPAEAERASRSRTRTAPWQCLQGREATKFGTVPGSWAPPATAPTSPAPPPYAAFPGTDPRLLTVRPCVRRTRSCPNQLKARRAVVLKLSAASTHWLLQNPTVLTVALAHWSPHWKGASLPGASLRSHESVAAPAFRVEFRTHLREPSRVPARIGARGGVCTAGQPALSIRSLGDAPPGGMERLGESESLRKVTRKPVCAWCLG